MVVYLAQLTGLPGILTYVCTAYVAYKALLRATI